MDNNILNYEILHTFINGVKKDVENHAEKNQSMSDAKNGRLFSKNGILSYSSLSGTKKIYENNDIVKYTGWCAFEDELIMFTKCNADLVIPEEDCTLVPHIFVRGQFGIDGSNPHDIFDSIYDVVNVNECVPSIPVDENEFNTPISCSNTSDVNDYGDLFIDIPVLPLQYCPVYNNDIPVNNTEYKDGIWSFKYNEQGNLVGTLIWIGYLNIPMDAKICTVGVDENNFYKRVYFTDYTNYFRVLNLKDKKLYYRRPEEFNVGITGTLLNPRIVEKRNNGSLAAMSVCYAYRLISENGQISDFSALSDMIKINKEDNDSNYSGGGPQENTNHSVLVSAIVPQFENFFEIQLIAIEYEGKNVPTSIKSIGRKPVAFYNEFEHFGNESEFEENITLADIFENSISWKYNSDITVNNNKLVAVGLRNEPSFVNHKNIDLDFALHGFHYQNGETHSCLLNPNPVKYNYINIGMNESFFYVKKKIFRSIQVLGNFWVRLINNNTGEYFEYIFNGKNIYQDFTLNILSWLNNIYENNPDFAVNFPNLKIANSQGKILFVPEDENIITDFYNYNLVFSTTQVILDTDNAIEIKNYNWPVNDTERNNKLVYGAVSNGFYNGNGVRVTVSSKADKVMSKTTDWPNGNGPIIDIKTPTMKKGVMKGEIYRLGILWYKNGNKLFTTILGDLKIPDIGQKRRELAVDGTDIGVINYPNNDVYKNFIVSGNDMFAMRLELRFEVRISCEMARMVDSYQIVYVERTEENRSIIAQGISAPLQRMLDFSGSTNGYRFDNRLINKWNLPYYGGPLIDARGLTNYDMAPFNTDKDYFGSNFNWKSKITTNRRLFYFDAPDMIFNDTSDNKVDSAILDYLMSVETDHDRHNIAIGYNRETTNNDNSNGGVGTQITFEDGSSSNDDYEAPFGNPKFSTKIPYNKLGLNDDSKPFFINVSVFANLIKQKKYPLFVDDTTKGSLDFTLPLFPERSSEYTIKASRTLEQGETAGSFVFDEGFSVCNAAAVLGAQGWFWQTASRLTTDEDFGSFKVNNISLGRRSLFIKTEDNLFNGYTMLDQNKFPVWIKRSFGTSDHNNFTDIAEAYDTHIISNLKKPNTESLYGGRTEYAYSKNEYIKMSDVMPINKNNVTTQLFNVQGDVYCTLFIRNKNGYMGSSIPERRPFNYRNDVEQLNRYGAWCYAVVLETMVEPKLTYSEDFYRESDNIIFNMEELMNEAYLQRNNLKTAIPRPLNFKDDPILTNIVAVSDVKLSGDYYDAFTKFRTNEFFELDKEKGAAYNIVSENDKIYVVQEHQTSLLYFDEKNFITPDNGGEAIQVKQGDGASISGRSIISQYGTSIRRAIIKNPDFGFVFFDERKKEFIKINKPLFFENEMSLFYNDFFHDNKITDCEGYYDPKFKETNIRFRTKTNKNFIISYNEALKCFNGTIEINNDLYPLFQEKIITPYANSSKLAEMNNGDVLSFFEENEKKKMYIEVISVPDFKRTQIIKSIGLQINTDFKVEKLNFETSLGQTKEVLGTHSWYKIREGMHNIPALNEQDNENIRGEWFKIGVTIKSLDNKKINIFSLINYIRNSYK